MISISEMKRLAARLDLAKPVVVSQNGLPVMVITSYKDYVKEQELLNTLTVLVKSLQGKTISSEAFQEKLEQRKENSNDSRN